MYHPPTRSYNFIWICICMACHREAGEPSRFVHGVMQNLSLLQTGILALGRRAQPDQPLLFTLRYTTRCFVVRAMKKAHGEAMGKTT